jgi:hypothetical protein
MASDDFAGGQVENLFPANRPVEVPVEVFQRFLFSEAGRASAAGDLSLVSHGQFVLEKQFQELGVVEPIRGRFL